MKGWWVPGLAIGIVDRGKTVFRRGFGVSDTVSMAPVSAKTLFGIGSVSKSMTALSFAVSHAQKELSLDTPINIVLPYFPDGITLKHLLSHTAGWPRHDALWYLNAYDRHELPRRLALLPKFSRPGRSFQYNNVPFSAVGEFLTEFAGIPWDDWVRSTVLSPAGMTDALTDVSVFWNCAAARIPSSQSAKSPSAREPRPPSTLRWTISRKRTPTAAKRASNCRISRPDRSILRSLSVHRPVTS